MPPKTRPTQDPSGHVCFDAAQSAFFQKVQNRAERIEAARTHGVLVYPPQRNPLRAEKTPRKKDHKCFNFSIPEGPKDLKAWDRWEYPTLDFGLMGKFRSQKHIYDNYMAKHSDYQNKKADFIEQENAGRGLGSRGEGPGQGGAQGVALRRDQGGDGSNKRSAAYEAFENDAKNRLPPKLALPAPQDAVPEHDPGATKISQFRMVGPINPEALAKWRAKRAADFVTKQKHPLDPPTARELAERPFVVATVKTNPSLQPEELPEPGAGKVTKIRAPVNKYAAAPEVDTARMQQSLGSLMAALARTEDEISRTELKLALKNKQKSF